MANDIKARHWAIVVYPESAPENWIDILSETMLPFAVSPLHDKDVNPDGEVKKAHWHVILSWDGPQRATAAKKMAELLNSPIPIKIESVKGAYQYFTHKNNPEKFQYDEKEIRVFNGFDISQYVALTNQERYQAIRDIIKIIHERGIVEYLDLLDILVAVDDSLFRVACDNTILFNAVVRSARHRVKNGKN